MVTSFVASEQVIVIRFVQHPNKSWHKFKHVARLNFAGIAALKHVAHYCTMFFFRITTTLDFQSSGCSLPLSTPKCLPSYQIHQMWRTRKDTCRSCHKVWLAAYFVARRACSASCLTSELFTLHDRDCHDWLHNRFNASLVFLLQVPVLGYSRAAMGCRSSATPVLSGCRPSRRVDARLWDLCRGKAVWVTRKLHRSWFPESSRSGVDSTSKLSNRKIHLDDYQGMLKENVRCCELANWGGFTVPWSHFFCWPKLRKLGIEHVPAVLFMSGFKYPGRIEIHVEGLVSLSALPFSGTAWGLFGAASLRSPSKVRC